MGKSSWILFLEKLYINGFRGCSDNVYMHILVNTT